MIVLFGSKRRHSKPGAQALNVLRGLSRKKNIKNNLLFLEWRKGTTFPRPNGGLPILHGFPGSLFQTFTLHSPAALTDMHLSQPDNQTIIEGTSSWHVCSHWAPCCRLLSKRKSSRKYLEPCIVMHHPSYFGLGKGWSCPCQAGEGEV